MRRFEFVAGGSSKFWEIGQTGTQVTVHFGRIGTTGQTQAKDFDSWDGAAEHVRKMVAEKVREGYLEVEGIGPRPEDLPGYPQPRSLPPFDVPVLPDDGPLAVGDVQLPSGRSLRADPEYRPKGSCLLSRQHLAGVRNDPRLRRNALERPNLVVLVGLSPARGQQRKKFQNLQILRMVDRHGG